MTSYFADVGDVSAMQIVNMAQTDYGELREAVTMPQFASLPVLSPPRRSRPVLPGADFTDVAAGPIAINNAADLYLFPNTLYAVKVDGSGLRPGSGRSAAASTRLIPARTTEQSLTGTAPGYTFDMLTHPDVSYEIDVSKPFGSRIVNLSYKGHRSVAVGRVHRCHQQLRAPAAAATSRDSAAAETIFASPDAIAKC